MRLHLPHYLGGDEVDLETDSLTDNEQIVGWCDEFGTITSSRVNVYIGDVVSTKEGQWSALVINLEELRKLLA